MWAISIQGVHVQCDAVPASHVFLLSPLCGPSRYKVFMCNVTLCLHLMCPYCPRYVGHLDTRCSCAMYVGHLDTAIVPAMWAISIQMCGPSRCDAVPASHVSLLSPLCGPSRYKVFMCNVTLCLLIVPAMWAISIQGVHVQCDAVPASHVSLLSPLCGPSRYKVFMCNVTLCLHLMCPYCPRYVVHLDTRCSCAM